MPAGSLHFNVSHAAGLSCIALSERGPVGVDVELADRTIPVEELAARFFHLEEKYWLSGLPEDQRRDGFFRLWVRKEALAKAIGVGLKLDFALHALNGPFGQRLLIQAKAAGGVAETHWEIADIEAGGSYKAAVALGRFSADAPAGI